MAKRRPLGVWSATATRALAAARGPADARADRRTRLGRLAVVVGQQALGVVGAAERLADQAQVQLPLAAAAVGHDGRRDPAQVRVELRPAGLRCRGSGPGSPPPRRTGRTPSPAASATRRGRRSAGRRGSARAGHRRARRVHVEGERVVERVHGQRQRVLRLARDLGLAERVLDLQRPAPSPCSRRSPIPGSRAAPWPGTRAGSGRRRGGRARRVLLATVQRGCTVRPHRSGQDRRRARARPRSCASAARTRSRSRRTPFRSTAASRPSRAPRRAAEQAELEHRLLSFVDPSETFSAGEFAERAHAEIDAALAAGRRPIVVGGTGLYLQAALTDLELRPPPDPAIRAARHGRARRARPGAAPRRAGRAGARRRRGDRPARPHPRRARARAARDGGGPGPGRRRTRASGPPSCATPRCSAASRWSARRCTSGSTPASTRWSPPAPPTRSRRADAAGAGRDRARGARLRGAAARRRGGDEAPHAQLREAPARLDAPPPGRARIDLTDRERRRSPPRSPVYWLAPAREEEETLDSRCRADRRAGRIRGARSVRLCRARLLEHRAQHHPVGAVGRDPDPNGSPTPTRPPSRRASTTRSRRSSTTSRTTISTATSSPRSSARRARDRSRASPSRARACASSATASTSRTSTARRTTT